MLKTKSLALKFILFFSGSSVLIFLAIIGLNYHFSKRLLMENIRQNAENLTERTVNRIETVLAAVKKIPENVSGFLDAGELDGERLKGLLKTVVINNPEIYGCGVAYEPYAFDPKSLYYAPYFAKEKTGLTFYNLGSETYRYFYMDWYQIPRELGRPSWSEPYFDDIVMSTYSVPFYSKGPGGKVFRGVVQADISLQWLADIVSSVKVLKTGDAYLISRNGTIITHPRKELIMNETLFTVAEARHDPALREIGRKMVRGEKGFVPFISIARNKKAWMYYAPVPSTGWSLAVVFPEDELLADIRRNTLAVGLLGVAGTVLLVIVVIALSRSITRPLRRMAGAAQAIGAGNLDAALPAVDSGDEVGRLAGSFRQMRDSLKEYIKKLTETTAAKERFESELKIAREIQESILPKIFPAFPDRKEFDIYAMMEPAKEVGGDFYDFFLINDRRLFFVMGDVSGKGVPAALFMMITKTLLKNEALQGVSAGQILCRVNNIIALDNPTSMFATVFCAILDTKTGQLEYANAGHNPPLSYSRQRGFEFMKLEKSFVLGPIPGFQYKEGSMSLGQGDCFFLYTDGITEALSPEKKFYSEARLKEALTRIQPDDIAVSVRTLRAEIKEFAGTEPQSDDITMLMVKYKGRI